MALTLYGADPPIDPLASGRDEPKRAHYILAWAASISVLGGRRSVSFRALALP